MPKAAKGKGGKEADFKKVKTKLGKGKKVATNATNTSFKARSIALPGQAPLNRAAAQQDPSGLLNGGAEGSEPLTNAGLNLDEVFIRLRHPNAGVRRDALAGVKEILKVKQGMEVGRVMRALGGMLADEEPSVRKAVLSFLDWYFSHISEASVLNQQATLAPHLPLFLMQTSSALSHIFADVRLDAARLVLLLLEHAPAHITAGWPSAGNAEASSSGGSSILEGLRLALGLGGEKASSAQARLTAGGKLVFLRAVLGFVHCALGGEGKKHQGQTADYDRSIWAGWLDDADIRKRESSKGSTIQIAKDGLVVGALAEGSMFKQGAWGIEADPAASWELGRLDAGPSRNQPGDAGKGSVMSLFLQLHPLLQSTFLESAPSAFSPSSNLLSAASASAETHTELCATSATLISVLGKAIIAQTKDSRVDAEEVRSYAVRSGISDFLKRMSTYFPFPSSGLASASSSAGLDAGLELNLSYARLAALLAPQPTVLSFPSSSAAQQGRQREAAWKTRIGAVEQAWNQMRETTERKRREKGKGKAGELWAMDEVSGWVADLLDPNSNDISTPSLAPSTFSALLPIIWALSTQPSSILPSGPEDDGKDTTADAIGTALLAYIARQPASSQARSIGDDFLIHLIRAHENPHPVLPFFISATSPLRSSIRAWIENIPKALWELGNKNERATEGLMRFLLDMGLKGEKGAETPFSFVGIEAYPGIAARLAPFFHLSHPARGSTLGPWTRLGTVPLKRLGLDMARVWQEWDTDGRLTAAVQAAEQGIAR